MRSCQRLAVAVACVGVFAGTGVVALESASGADQGRAFRADGQVTDVLSAATSDDAVPSMREIVHIQ